MGLAYTQSLPDEEQPPSFRSTELPRVAPTKMQDRDVCPLCLDGRCEECESRKCVFSFCACWQAEHEPGEYLTLVRGYQDTSQPADADFEDFWE